MSQNQIVVFDAPEYSAALLSQASLSLGKSLMGGLASGINRISIKGNRFRLMQAGQEVQVLESSSMDVVIVGAADGVSRIYFEGKYVPGEKLKPSCWSKDGVKPESNVPGDSKQANNCASCAQNIKGSAVTDNGQQSRACKFKKRIVVISPNQLGTGHTPEPYAIEVNSMSLFGDGEPSRNRYSLGGYGKFLSTPLSRFPNGVPPLAVITKLTLDPDSSVPKLLFGVSTNEGGRASFLSEAQFKEASLLSKSDAVVRLVGMAGEELLDADVETPEAPAIAAQPKRAEPAPKVVVKTWQEVALANGADADDVEGIEDAGGPYTEKGRKRWDKAVDECEPPALAEAKVKPSKPTIVPTQTAAVQTPAPTVAASVGKKLADTLSAFDDE